jgi:hypothetical protein
MKNPIWIFVIDTELGIENGCPRRDPRQNFAGFDALRKREEFHEKSAGGPYAETHGRWERHRSLVGGSQGPLLGCATERGQGSFVRGNS